MKKFLIIKILLILIVINVSDTNGQRRGRWYQIQDNDEKSSFVDTTTIKVTDDQISVWVLEIFNEPFNIDDSDSPAKRSRTQYLFNITDRNYTVIGNLYYDEIGKIISQNYNPIIGGSGRTFYEPIADDEDVSGIFKAVTELVGVEVEEEEEGGAVSDSASIAKRIEDLQNSKPDSLEESLNNTPDDVLASDSSNDPNIVAMGQPVDPGITLRENETGPDSDPLDLPYKTNDLPDGANVAQIYNPATGDYIELVSQPEVAEEEPVEEEKPEEETLEYDLASERNVTNTIFTDGNQYCFQVSSWKRKNIAESEVARLKRNGHNAYFVEARPKNKSGIWYRVRIGYFDSQEEARNYQRKVR